MVLARFGSTLEVVISKLFPAGAGWQAASIAADQLGHAADSAQFAAITGAGDGLAVVAGHTTYYTVKKMVWDSKISLGTELGLAVWLGAAATCSGGLWQPLVNTLQVSDKLPFEIVFAGTWLGCGTAFLGGLRVGRMVMPWIGAPTNANMGTDAALSMAIGGASAFFVGTDTAYLAGQGNFLRPVVGIEDIDTDILGCVKAGSSTALGFTVAQTAQNLSYPKGQAWNDP